MKIKIYDTQVEIFLSGSNDIKYKFSNSGDSNQNIIKYLKDHKDQLLTLLQYGTKDLEYYYTLAAIEAQNYEFLERVSIIEYDGGLSREEAEQLAMQEFNNRGIIYET